MLSYRHKNQQSSGSFYPKTIHYNNSKTNQDNLIWSVLEHFFFYAADRCESYNPCQQRCVEDENGISCACNQGYELQADGINCQGQCLSQGHFQTAVRN